MGQGRVIVVGAGPAGVRCAQVLAQHGVRPVLVDENRRDGGQIYRRQPESFGRSYAKLYGTQAQQALELHETFGRISDSIDYLPDTVAWNIADHQLHLTSEGRAFTLEFGALVLCTGATDRIMPVKGWQRAGTFSLGAAQIALKAQACSVGASVVFLGSGPLLYLVASQYVEAGANVVAVLDTSAFSRRVRALPQLMARLDLMRKGASLVSSLKRAGIRMETGVEPVEILGTDEAGVSGVRYRNASGETRELACDAVALGQHLRPETQLADIAGCRFAFDAGTRQWLPESDELGRTSVKGVYLAGDGMRVLGADGAEVAGQLAAVAVLGDDGHKVDAQGIDALKQQRARLERFASGIAAAFPWPAEQITRVSDDTIVCRCEAIEAGELRRVVRDEGAREVNRAKAFSRVGMGRCQGRYCVHAAAEVIAGCADVPIEQVGRHRSQAPVKPLSISTRKDKS
jgi:NADPH-dependent 2,4-dienoyl-CoA reductase/sulfur reductase-like enzyme